MITRAIYTLLTTNTTLTGLVSTNIFPLKTPQATAAPFIVYAVMTEPVDTKDGVATQEMHDVQITAFSKGYENLQSIKDAVKSALDRKTGTISSEKIQTVVFVDDREDYDQNLALYKCDMLFTIRRNK